jgi:DNA invertase Pin-like site-specific DNA recombinase
MKIYGYARVSTSGQAKNGNSLEDQERILKDNGCVEIFKENFTGTKISRPEFDKLLKKLESGDTLIITKLDRFARTASQGIDLIRSLVDRGITVNILNMGVANNTPTGKLMITIMSGFAEFERDMIVERTQAGKEIAKQNPDFKDGRPPVYTDHQLDWGIELLKKNSLKQVEKMTGISMSTLKRELIKRNTSITELRNDNLKILDKGGK